MTEAGPALAASHFLNALPCYVSLGNASLARSPFGFEHCAAGNEGWRAQGATWDARIPRPPPAAAADGVDDDGVAVGVAVAPGGGVVADDAEGYGAGPGGSMRGRDHLKWHWEDDVATWKERPAQPKGDLDNHWDEDAQTTCTKVDGKPDGTCGGRVAVAPAAAAAAGEAEGAEVEGEGGGGGDDGQPGQFDDSHFACISGCLDAIEGGGGQEPTCAGIGACLDAHGHACAPAFRDAVRAFVDEGCPDADEEEAAPPP